jgi:hypothetical protein
MFLPGYAHNATLIPLKNGHQASMGKKTSPAPAVIMLTPQKLKLMMSTTFANTVTKSECTRTTYPTMLSKV